MTRATSPGAGLDVGRTETVRRVAREHATEPGPLLVVLHEVMAALGHIERGDVVAIADVLGLSVADVHGVVSFYSDLRTNPVPAHVVRLCRGEACQSVGAEALLDDVRSRFADRDDVEVGEVFCLGNCALGPSGQLDGRLHGRLSTTRVSALTQEWSS